MADDLTPEQRRRNMQAIKSKDTTNFLCAKHYGVRESVIAKTAKRSSGNLT